MSNNIYENLVDFQEEFDNIKYSTPLTEAYSSGLNGIRPISDITNNNNENSIESNSNQDLNINDAEIDNRTNLFAIVLKDLLISIVIIPTLVYVFKLLNIDLYSIIPDILNTILKNII